MFLRGQTVDKAASSCQRLDSPTKYCSSSIVYLSLRPLVAQTLVTDTGRVRWLVDRFKSAEPGEILSRSVEAYRHLVLAGSLSKVRNRRGRYPGRAACPLAPSTSGEWEKVSEQAKNRVIAAASHWLDHHITVFALHNTSFGDSIDWHCTFVAPQRTTRCELTA